MSGRKSCEVVDLLEEGQKGRILTEHNLDSSIKSSCDNIRTIVLEINEVQKNVSCMDSLELSQDAKKMFGNNGVKNEQEYKNIKNKILNYRVALDMVNECERELKDLDNNNYNLDKEASRIRNSIKNKRDYCDKEYASAKKLNNMYNENKKARKMLDEKMRDAYFNVADIFRDIKIDKKSFDSYSKTIDEMNVLAENRKRANELKSKISQEWKDIPEEWANKFSKEKYKELDSKLSNFLQQDDDTIINNVTSIKSEISVFSNNLMNKINTWKKEKSEAEQVAKLINDTINTGYYDPIEYNVDGEDAEKIKLFVYVERYKSLGYKEKFLHNHAIAEKAMNDENFIEAKKYYDKALDIAIEAKDYALNLQENMIKKMELAAAIEAVMEELYYDPEVSIINDNPNDGFRIRCSAGDEIIDFNNINYEDGQPVVDIDHTEAVNGNCHKSWNDIVVKMREKGIPITDVTKNGISILKKSNTKNRITDSSKSMNAIN